MRVSIEAITLVVMIDGSMEAMIDGQVSATDREGWMFRTFGQRSHKESFRVFEPHLQRRTNPPNNIDVAIRWLVVACLHRRRCDRSSLQDSGVSRKGGNVLPRFLNTSSADAQWKFTPTARLFQSSSSISACLTAHRVAFTMQRRAESVVGALR